MVKDTEYKILGTAKQTASLVAGKLFALIVTFAMPLFLTRYLSKDDYGLYSQFYLVVTFFTCFFSIGFETNLFYFYPKASNQDKKSLVLQTFIFLAIFSLVAIVFTGNPLFEKELIGNTKLIDYYQLIIIGIFLIMPQCLIEPLYVVRKDYLISILYPPGEVLLRLFLIIGLVVLHPGLKSIFMGVIGAAAICYIFVLRYSFKEFNVKDINRKIVNFSLIRKQLLYNLPFGIAMSLNLLALRFDKIICIKYMTPSEFATYSIAFFGIPGIMQVYDSFTKVQVIEMTIKYQENKVNMISEIYKSLAAKAYSFSIPLLMIVFLYAKKIIIFLFTGKYADSVPFFRVYLLTFLVLMLGAGLILRASGRTIDTFKSYVYSCIITLPATFFLIKYYGMWGAMTSALFSLILPRILMIVFEIRFLKIGLRNYFPWRKILKIISISFFPLVPFILLEIFFEYGVIITMIFGILYLFTVAVLELKYNLFVLPKELIIGRISIIASKYKFF